MLENIFIPISTTTLKSTNKYRTNKYNQTSIYKYVIFWHLTVYYLANKCIFCNNHNFLHFCRPIHNKERDPRSHLERVLYPRGSKRQEHRVDGIPRRSHSARRLCRQLHDSIRRLGTPRERATRLLGKYIRTLCV